RLQGDWSSDVCSSDLRKTSSGRSRSRLAIALQRSENARPNSVGVARDGLAIVNAAEVGEHQRVDGVADESHRAVAQGHVQAAGRSEERRVGKECRYRG